MSDERTWAEALTEATNNHDINALVDCFADDYVNETPAHPARGFRGREQVRRNWTAIFAGVPDFGMRVVRQVVDGSEVWMEVEMAGTRRDGAAHLLRGVIRFEVMQNHATRARFYVEPVEEASGDVNAAVDRAVGVSRP
jgi:ketosteroid isomerase-like protein